MLIVTRGFGPMQMIVTRGYGLFGKALREVLRIVSEITRVLKVTSNVRNR